MDIDSVGTSNWLLDYDIVDDITVAVAGNGGNFQVPPGGFCWPAQTVSYASSVGLEANYTPADSDGVKELGSRKRMRPESASASGSKACREKLRRDRLNERFLELGSILEPGRPVKTDKAAILSDAFRKVTELRSEMQKLKESNENFQAKIKELKAEKNELRDEKQRLKAQKEKLEQQVKTISAQPGFSAPSSGLPAAFAARGQTAGNKLIPFIGYPGIAMWQFMPPAAVDTSQDHVLRPPVA